MRPSIVRMRTSARGPSVLSLLAFLQVGMTSAVSAVESTPAPILNNEAAQVSRAQIAARLAYWPAHCAAVEQDGNSTEASRCWWYAAAEITRHAKSDQILAEEVKALRTDWLWRGARLSLQSPRPEQRVAALIEPSAAAHTGPDARSTGPLFCSSTLSIDDAKCFDAAGAIALATAPPTLARKKKLTKADGTKPKAKVKTATALKKARRKRQIIEPAWAPWEEAALPVFPRVQKGSNLTPKHLARRSLNTAAQDDW